MIAVPEAIRIILQETAKLLVLRSSAGEGGHDEEVSCRNVLTLRGRVLARDVVMRAPGYPPYAASIMDGYAIQDSAFLEYNAADSERNDDINNEENGWTHSVEGRVYAGQPPKDTNDANRTTNLPLAYYITTGAMIPNGCDRVVPIEDVLSTSADRTKIKLALTVTKTSNKWIRTPGCDIAAGTTILSAGSTLDHVSLGLLLQSGQPTVHLRRTVAVGVLSTGNELWQPPANDTNENNNPVDWWENLKPGTIPDVNRPVILSLLGSMANVHVLDLGVVGDHLDDAIPLEQVLRTASESCDIIITTGGVSRGETDLVERVLVERLHGQLHFSRLHMKPGKPNTFVTVKSSQTTCLVFALPGNPVSAIVGTHLLVRPSLNLMIYGSAELEASQLSIQRIVEMARVHTEVTAELAHDVKLDFERPEYHRVVIQSTTGQATIVSSTGIQQSSRLLSLRGAQGLLVLPQVSAEHPVALAGEQYTLLRFDDCNVPLQLPVSDSRHLKRTKQPKAPLQVGVVLIAPDNPLDTELSTRVEMALRGPHGKPGSVSIQSVRIYSGLVDRFYSCITEDAVDVLVIACRNVPGSFRHYVKLANLLRHNLTKVADGMALLARRGAAQQEPMSAIFEVVIGYRNSRHGGTIVALLPEEGLESALENIRGLLKYALQIARSPLTSEETKTAENTNQTSGQ